MTLPGLTSTAAPRWTPSSARREFLFLQGLAGPFFQRLGQYLSDSGHGVHRVNFHGGDWLFWKSGLNFRGRDTEWPDFVEQLLVERNITDMVLFGDCRPLHRAAIKVAERLQIQVHVFEEGYIRPDWVTVERGGVNGNSSLPRNLQYYTDTAANLPTLPCDLNSLPPIATSFRRRALEDLQYNIAGMLLGWHFPHYKTHRPWHPLVEYYGWGRRLLAKGRARKRSQAAYTRLQADGRPYFVFPLQLDCDYQVRRHSPFRNLQPAITHVLRSFAENAPADVLLVVKSHPLDNGLTDWRERTLQVATLLGIEDRLIYLEDGDIAKITKPALGMVTINSTSGTLALSQDVPVVVLGDAVYNVPGMTFAGTLDEFWTAPTPPLPGTYEAFRRVLVERCLVRGGYFSEQGLSSLVEGAATRLARADERAHSAVDARAPARTQASSLPAPLRGAVRG